MVESGTNIVSMVLPYMIADNIIYFEKQTIHISLD